MATVASQVRQSVPVVDIAALAYHFLDREGEVGAPRVPTLFAPDALERLLRYDWPGNVRELQRVVQYAVVRAAGRERVLVEDLPNRVAEASKGQRAWTATDC